MKKIIGLCETAGGLFYNNFHRHLAAPVPVEKPVLWYRVQALFSLPKVNRAVASCGRPGATVRNLFCDS
jgi:hypothetical protein